MHKIYKLTDPFIGGYDATHLGVWELITGNLMTTNGLTTSPKLENSRWYKYIEPTTTGENIHVLVSSDVLTNTTDLPSDISLVYTTVISQDGENMFTNTYYNVEVVRDFLGVEVMSWEYRFCAAVLSRLEFMDAPPSITTTLDNWIKEQLLASRFKLSELNLELCINFQHHVDTVSDNIYYGTIGTDPEQLNQLPIFTDIEAYIGRPKVNIGMPAVIATTRSGDLTNWFYNNNVKLSRVSGRSLFTNEEAKVGTFNNTVFGPRLTGRSRNDKKYNLSYYMLLQTVMGCHAHELSLDIHVDRTRINFMGSSVHGVMDYSAIQQQETVRKILGVSTDGMYELCCGLFEGAIGYNYPPDKFTVCRTFGEVLVIHAPGYGVLYFNIPLTALFGPTTSLSQAFAEM